MRFQPSALSPNRLLIAFGILIAGIWLPAIRLEAAPQTAPLVPGLGFVNVATAAKRANAVQEAARQRSIVFKSQLGTAQSRRIALEAQLRPLIERYNRDQASAKANSTDLREQLRAINERKQSAEAEIAIILQPVARSDAWVREQIAAKVADAVHVAMVKRRISIVLSSQGVFLAQDGYDLTNDTAEAMNAALPSIQIVPPESWVQKIH